MGFTTQVFLFIFLPAVLLTYYLIYFLQNRTVLRPFLEKMRAADWTLIVCGLGFYAWACFDDVFGLGIYVIAVYALGKWIEHWRDKGHRLAVLDDSGQPVAGIPLGRLSLFAGVFLAVLCLLQFRYPSVLARIWNLLLADDLAEGSVVAPLGISFLTFSAISYLADIYKGKAPAGSLADCALYLTFFPKVISGPIVLWRDYAPQIPTRQCRMELAVDGINRIMIGFGKKTILADQLGSCISKLPPNGMDSPSAWFGALAYMLQLYYDFSGYSDIAIGLCSLFGFSVKENFRFPYLSKSISEFWRRWHISLGMWFREYVYIPLGGSRAGKKRTYVNLGIVFVLTGIWHGAGWNYLLWGAINGLFCILERAVQEKRWYGKMPECLKWFATMVAVFFCWQLFRFQNWADFVLQLQTMFGAVHYEAISYTWRYYFDSQIVTLMAVGSLGATVWGFPFVQRLYQRGIAGRFGYAVQQAVLLIIFGMAILFMVNATYSPFLYFQY